MNNPQALIFGTYLNALNLFRSFLTGITRINNKMQLTERNTRTYNGCLSDRSSFTFHSTFF